jgi:hypothetical protein
VKHVAAWLLFFVTLWWLWLLLVGEWNHQEWIAATAVAAVAATVGEIARSRAEAHPADGIAQVAQAYSVVPMIVVDFALLMWALVTNPRRDGSFRSCNAADPWTAYLATFSPNAYVIADHELHRLVPFEKSQEPAT